MDGVKILTDENEAANYQILIESKIKMFMLLRT